MRTAMGCRWTTMAIVACCAVAAPAAAAPDRWSPAGPPAGTLLDLAIGAAGELFVAADQSVVYVSRDHGATWAWSGLGMGTDRVRALAVDRHDGALYAAGESRVYRSLDAGVSWQTLAAGLDLGPLTEGVADALGIAAGSPVTLYLARGGRLLRGTGGGTVWQPVLVTPTSISSLVADPADPLSLFVGTELPGALYHSADGGATWSPVTTVDPVPGDPPFDNPFYSGVFELTAIPGAPTVLLAVVGGGLPLNLYRSLDAGATWHAVKTLPPGSFGVEAIAFASGAPATLFVLSQLGNTPSEPGILFALYASRDLGATWLRVDTSEVIAGELRIDPASGDFYTVFTNGIGHGALRGVTWTYSWLSDPAAVGQGCGPAGELRFPPRSSSRVYAVSNCEVLRSDDGGASWRPPPPTTLRSLSSSPAVLGVYDLALDPVSADRLVAATARGVMSSANGGATWRQLLSPPPGGLPLVAVAAPSRGTILAGGCGIWVSSDRGAHWRQTLGCNDAELQGISAEVIRFVIDPARPQVAYAEAVLSGDEEQPVVPIILRSTDSGESWRVLFDGADLIAVDPRVPGRLYVFGPQGVYQSDDGGDSWREISEFAQGDAEGQGVGDLAVDLFDARTLWAARPDGVWQSVDGGVTWHQRSAGLCGRPAFELFLDPHRRGTIAVAAGALFAASFR